MRVCDCCLENGDMYALEEATCYCHSCKRDLCDKHTVIVDGSKTCIECSSEGVKNE